MKNRMIKILFMVVIIVGLIPIGVASVFADTITVDYVDAKGITRTATDVTEITEGGEYGPGWYILRGTQNLDGITFSGKGDVYLILENGADITVSGGILLNNGIYSTSFTIYAQPTDEGEVEGKLTANGSQKIAGIGAGDLGHGNGDIIVNGGTIIVNGGDFAAGIGSGYNGSCGNIIVNDGTVTANGSVGIGAGRNGSCGNITVNGGTVTANCYSSGAAIGSESGGCCGNVTINGGTVTAYGGIGGVAIGIASHGRCGDITITGTPTIMAGIDAQRAQIVNKYTIEWYLNVTYIPGVEPINPDPHIHDGSLQSAVTKTGKTVEYFECSCGKLFEDAACTIEITDLMAWLAKGGSEDPASLSGNGNPATGITGNGTWGITLMLALLIGLILFLRRCSTGFRNEG